MRLFIEFGINAFPWIAIGLFIALACVQARAKQEGKDLGRAFSCAAWFPAFVFFVIAISEMQDGDKASGTTWLILGIINIILNFINSEKDSDSKRE